MPAHSREVFERLPPDPLPALPEPDGTLGPYAHSPLRTVTGTRVNPEAAAWYQHREATVTHESPVRTCCHPDLELWLDNVGGFDPRCRMEQLPIDEWPLPRGIPRVRLAKKFPPFDLPVGAYAVDYQNLNASTRRLPLEDAWVSTEVRQKFPEGSFLILDFVGEHRLIEPLWAYGREFWEHPFLDQFDAVVIPEFSTFVDDPKPQYLIGERMKQIFAQEGWESGRNVIPSIAWSSETSLRRQADLIGSMWPKVNTVFLDLLGLGVDRVAWLWSRFEMLYRYIAPLPQRILISGGSSGWSIAELHEIFPRGNFHLLHIGPFTNAMRMDATPRRRAEAFRAECHKIEEWGNGLHLPPRMARPEIPPELLPR